MRDNILNTKMTNRQWKLIGSQLCSHFVPIVLSFYVYLRRLCKYSYWHMPHLFKSFCFTSQPYVLKLLKMCMFLIQSDNFVICKIFWCVKTTAFWWWFNYLEKKDIYTDMQCANYLNFNNLSIKNSDRGLLLKISALIDLFVTK